MAHLIENKVEFLHVPKTGGSWFSYALTENNINKLKIDRIHSNHDQTVFYRQLGSGRHLLSVLVITLANRLGFKNKKKNIVPKFCVVRNPFSWYESWWRFSRKNYVTAFFNCEITPAREGEDFNDYIYRIIKQNPGHLTNLYNGYDKKYTLHIGRIENLVEDLCQILKHYNIKLSANDLEKIPATNVSEKCQVEWDPDLKKSLLLTELPSFIKYGYIKTEQLKGLGIESKLQISNKLVSSLIYDLGIEQLT